MEVKRSQKPMMLRIGPFGGIDLSSSPAEIDQKRSPDMVNFSIDERGSLNKRTGYERIYLESLGNGAIHGMHEYRKKMVLSDFYWLTVTTYTHNQAISSLF